MERTLLPWCVLLAPLVAAALITVFTRRSKKLSSFLSCAAVLTSFAGACMIFGRKDTSAVALNWIDFPGIFTVPFGFVLANNFVMLFIFWELVGFTSYVLIGHWFERDAAADAANKAFITNRIGDFGFILGILMVWMATGSVVFAEIAPRFSVLASHPV